MSAIAQLPDDLLSHIFCLAAGSAIYAKFDVARVSARWRSVALNSPLLWTRIHISSRSYISDCGHLALVLERTGSSALLDVVLSGPFPAANALYVAAALAPYAARMRGLDSPDDNFDALLTSRMDFPALEILRVRGVGGPRKRGPKLHLTAANLRVLHLASVQPPIRFDELFCERMEEVSIHHCDAIKVTDLLTVLGRCVRLAHLEFIASTTPARREEISWDVSPLRQLRTLNIAFPFPEILDLLDNVVARDSALHSVAAFTSCNREADCVLRLCTAISRGLGPLTTFKFYDKYSVALCDDAGRTRDLLAMNLPRHAWVHFWPYFAKENGARSTVREMHMPFEYWNGFAEGFADHPPGSNLRTLRLLISEYDFDYAESDLPALRKIVLPGLERVEFWASGVSLPAAGVIYVLRSISSGHATRPIEVQVRGLTQSVKYLQGLLDKDDSGRWTLVGAL